MPPTNQIQPATTSAASAVAAAISNSNAGASPFQTLPGSNQSAINSPDTQKVPYNTQTPIHATYYSHCNNPKHSQQTPY